MSSIVCDLTSPDGAPVSMESQRSTVIVLSSSDDENSPSTAASVSLNKRRRVDTDTSAASRTRRKSQQAPALQKPRGVIDLTEDSMKVSIVGPTVNASASGSDDRGVRPEKEALYTCSICLGEMKEISSTTCGHMFCHECIRAAVKANHRCPQCRKKLTLRMIHRVYLPSKSSAS